MPFRSQKPDLEDSINVAEAHGRILREAAAAAREKNIANIGSDPISLWVLVACGIVAVIAGGVLGSAGKLFAYGGTFREGYVRSAPPGTAASGPKPKEALEAYMAKGQRIYSSKCNGCHGPNAQGDGANYPALAGSPWVTGETERLAMIIINGLQGPTSNGRTYGVMPPQAAGLSPEDLAGIMTYVRNNFGNTVGDVVTAEMAAAALEISSKRPQQAPVTAAELNADHVKALPGAALDPKTLVDPASLKPVEAAAK